MAPNLLELELGHLPRHRLTPPRNLNVFKFAFCRRIDLHARDMCSGARGARLFAREKMGGEASMLSEKQ